MAVSNTQCKVCIGEEVDLGLHLHHTLHIAAHQALNVSVCMAVGDKLFGVVGQRVGLVVEVKGWVAGKFFRFA